MQGVGLGLGSGYEVASRSGVVMGALLGLGGVLRLALGARSHLT